MKKLDEMKLTVQAKSVNESFCRVAVAAFVSRLDPTVDEISDIKTAVSEAVTNCIVHAYKGEKYLKNKIIIECGIEKSEKTGKLHICVIDFGCGIENVDEAMQPFYTTSSPSERAGMGFTIMQAFTSDFTIESVKGEGTKISMTKIIEETGKDDNNA